MLSIGISGTIGKGDGFHQVKHLRLEDIERMILESIDGRTRNPKITEITLEDASPLNGVIELKENGKKSEKRVTAGVLRAKISTEEGRIFMMQLQTRFDGTGHQGYDLHLNIDLTLHDMVSGKMINELKDFVRHHVELYPITRTFQIFLGSSGRTIVAPVTYFPTDEDFEYSRADREFFAKVRSKSLTEEDKTAFNEVFKNHSDSVKKRIAELKS